MASNDLLFGVGAAAIAVIAYAGNVGGFKTWADNVLKIRPAQAQTPNQFQQPTIPPKGGKTAPSTPGQAFNDILNITGKAGGAGSQVKLGACYDAVSKTGVPTKCWRNRACGARAGTSVAICQYTCDAAYKSWVSQFGCKSNQAFAYPGFENVTVA